MPIYEFECERCVSRFEELVAAEAPAPPCPQCASDEVRRLFSDVSPPGRQPRGGAGAVGRIAARRARSGAPGATGADQAKRARGEQP